MRITRTVFDQDSTAAPTGTPRTDPIVLARDCVIDGGIGQTLPNYNVLVVGCSGTGKSLSTDLPAVHSTGGQIGINTVGVDHEGL